MESRYILIEVMDGEYQTNVFYLDDIEDVYRKIEYATNKCVDWLHTITDRRYAVEFQKINEYHTISIITDVTDIYRNVVHYFIHKL